MKHKIKFSTGQEISIENGATLSECTDITNTPILFGCRTGICSTCLVNISSGFEELEPATDDEQELLEIIAPERPHARLACQFKVNGDLEIQYIGK